LNAFNWYMDNVMFYNTFLVLVSVISNFFDFNFVQFSGRKAREVEEI